MKRSIMIAITLAAEIFFSTPFGGSVARAAMLSVKLPYAKGQSFILVQGYDTPPTHIKKDSYALDFSQNGCAAYGKPAVAAAAGKVMFMSQEGYNGGYGTELIIDHGGNIVSRYAHMIPDSITVSTSSVVRQGEVVGSIGDTGLVAGAACAEHPGTHLHFAMNTVNSDGSFTAYDPEPISGYINMMAGKWYLSDNGEDADVASATIGVLVSVTSTSNTPDTEATTSATTTILFAPAVVSTSASSTIPVGGVSVISASAPAAPTAPENVSTTSASTTTTTTTSTISITSSTPPDASSTATSLPAEDVTTSSGIFFQQTDDSASSQGSWYDDNWYDLGNGFSGTLNTLTLKGGVDDSLYFASQVSLQEFKDANYAALVQSFDISDDAPFTSTMATTTFTGLSILLKPYFYYRLSTVQDRQNRSVILAGTASTTAGMAMWNTFIYGTGRVEYTYPFFPFMIMDGVAATSTLAPPPITTPTDLTPNFDELGMQLNPTFGTSTDPDWSANPLHYQMNYSTSTTLSDDGWTSPGSIPVVLGNSYLIGVRALDGYGDVSGVATTTWSFPPGFIPYLLSPALGYANQYFTVQSTSTLQSIELFTTGFWTSAKNPDALGCNLALFYSDAPVAYNSWETRAADNGYNGYACAGHLTYSFASSSIVLIPGKQYQWIFEAQTGNLSSGGGVQFYGTATDTAGGLFNDPSLVNAKFVVNGDTGVLFAN